MIYILATSMVEATVYAQTVLNIPLRSQANLARVVMDPASIPNRFADDDVIRPTPQFERLAQTRPSGWSKPDWSRSRLVGDQEDRARAARLATSVRMRGGKILPAYDVPDELTPESIEKWLAEGQD